jgi:hypothetical protein
VARFDLFDLIVVYIECSLDGRFFGCHNYNFIVSIKISWSDTVWIANYKCRSGTGQASHSITSIKILTSPF